MIYNIFNLKKVLKDDLKIFEDENIYIIDESINTLKIHINSVFNETELIKELEKIFKREINYSLIAFDLIIYI